MAEKWKTNGVFKEKTTIRVTYPNQRKSTIRKKIIDLVHNQNLKKTIQQILQIVQNKKLTTLISKEKSSDISFVTRI